MIPCVDAILREVADDNQIAAISHYSQDPQATSVPLDWASRFPAVGDGAEDVAAMRPDLVITGPHVAPQTAAMLDRLGVRQLRIGVPASVAESKAQVSEVARVTGHPGRGDALNRRIDDAVTAARSVTRKHAPVALIWQDGGLVPGKGTLADELLGLAGFRSASEQLRLPPWTMLSIEDLLWAPPDIVLTGSAGMESDGLRGDDRMKRHPALAGARGHIMLADFPSSLLHCGGPVIIRTADRLAEVRRRWDRERGS
ncbi:MAG: ABC transporter substrate-binding protein [Sphingobium sp.]